MNDNQKGTVKLPTFNLGLEVSLDNEKIIFPPSVIFEKKAGKNLEQMRSLMYKAGDDVDQKLYEFYIGVFNKKDKEIIKASGLRYDIIMVYPGLVNGEYKKTSGHIHKKPEWLKTGYPEIYEVLYGTAMFILQKSENGLVKEFFAMQTEAGEKILIPPGYEHATVNIGSVPLVFTDLISVKADNEYNGIQNHGGMGYFVLDKDGVRNIIKNTAYKDVSPVDYKRPLENKALNISFENYVYDILVNDPGAFSYLDDPDEKSEEINYSLK
jgi:glucose-6-phosphate isomerase